MNQLFSSINIISILYEVNRIRKNIHFDSLEKLIACKFSKSIDFLSIRLLSQETNHEKSFENVLMKEKCQLYEHFHF